MATKRTPEPNRRIASSPALAAAVTALATLVLAYGLVAYREFLADDALISLRYAQRLLEGHGLTWTEGPRVEGYSNFLWVMLVSGAGLLGADLVAAARALGVICTVVAIAGVAWFPLRAGRDGAAAALSGAIVLALAGPVTAWARAGLEMPLVVALLAWALALAAPLFAGKSVTGRAALAPSIPLALLVWARPDGALFAACFFAAWCLARGASRESMRVGLMLVALPLAAWMAQEAFRVLYYGAWVPNTALVKIAFTSHRIESGLSYLGKGLPYFWSLWVLVAVGAVSGIVRREQRGITLLCLVPLLAWLAYLVFIGGDFFPAYRLLPPAIPPAALLAANVVAVTPRASRRRAASLVFAGLLLVVFGVDQRRDPENRRASAETWVWNAESVATVLRRAFGEQRPSMAVVSAGSFPYWTKFPSIDMLGLNDHHIARHRNTEFGRGFAGHELGDADYVLRRDPDLIQFSGVRRSWRTGYFRVETDLVAQPRFRDRYELVTFADPRRNASWPIWVKKESPKVGIRRAASMLQIPAHLLTLNPSTQAMLNEEGRLVVETSSERPAAIGGLALEAGRWIVEIDPPTAGVAPAFRTTGDTEGFRLLGPDATLELAQPARVDLVLWTGEGVKANVRQVLLRHTGR